MDTPRFKVGDVINSSLSSPKEVIDIREGKEGEVALKGWVGELCYVLRYVGGKQNTVIYSVKAVDSDHHPKGSEEFEAYEDARRG